VLICTSLRCRLSLFGVLVSYYVASAVFYDRHLPVAGTHIPWPSWAWCLGIAASLLWLLASIFMLGELCHWPRHSSFAAEQAHEKRDSCVCISLVPRHCSPSLLWPFAIMLGNP